MAKGKTQKLKLYYLIEYFKKHTDEFLTVSVAELIEYLAGLGITAERKSIYRDIEAIRDLGFEIISIRDRRY